MKKTTLPPLPTEKRAADTVASVATLTAADVAAMTGPALVYAYNVLNSAVPVKRFATPADGRKRLLASIAKVRGAAPKVGIDGIIEKQSRGTLEKTAEGRYKELKKSDALNAKRLAALNGEKAASKTAAAKKAGGKATIAGRCRELLAAGKSNETIWPVIKAEFGLPESKNTYPAYYRRKEAAKGNVYQVKS